MRDLGRFFKIFLHFLKFCLIYWDPSVIMRTAFTKGKDLCYMLFYGTLYSPGTAGKEVLEERIKITVLL